MYDWLQDINTAPLRYLDKDDHVICAYYPVESNATIIYKPDNVF